MTKYKKEDIAIIKEGLKDLALTFKKLSKQLDSSDDSMVESGVYKASFMLVNISKILEAYHKGESHDKV